MRATPRYLLVGVWAALATPRRLEAGLGELLAPASLSSGAGESSGRGDPEASVKLARFMLRLLSKLPGHTWRNTCLYRSVAECLALRRLGVSARLCLGVQKVSAEAEQLEAHAWVERDDAEITASGARPADVTPLGPSTERNAEGSK